MRRARILLILGIWVAILPYLGFPYSWKDILGTLTGLFLIYMSYGLREEYKGGATNKRAFDNFRENSPLESKASNASADPEIE